MGTAHSNANISSYHEDHTDIVHSSLKDMRSSMQQQSKPLQPPVSQQQPHEDEKKTMKSDKNSPIWLPRHHHNPHSQSHESLNSEHNLSKPLSVDDEEADTDLETDRLLGQQRLDDHGFYDEKVYFKGVFALHTVCYHCNCKKLIVYFFEILPIFSHRTIGVTAHRD